MKKKIYVAGPYTNPDPCVNTFNAIKAGNELLDAGFIPFVPHLTHYWHGVTPKPYQAWLDYDAEWIPACDGLLRLQGKSAGADAEMRIASQLKKPLFGSVADVKAYYEALDALPAVKVIDGVHHYPAADFTTIGKPRPQPDAIDFCTCDYCTQQRKAKDAAKSAVNGSRATKSETILEEAQRLVYGDRNSDYGHPADDFARIGRLWAAILGVDHITAEQAGLCQMMIKVSRECNKPKRDNRVDMVGYAACVERIHARKAGRE